MVSTIVRCDMDLKQASYLLTQEWPFHTAAQTEAVNTLISAGEKEIAKPPIVGTEMFQCPNCRRNLTLKNCVKKMYEYCPRCGQHLLWAKERL